jgi:hypothetical protein
LHFASTERNPEDLFHRPGQAPNNVSGILFQMRYFGSVPRFKKGAENGLCEPPLKFLSKFVKDHSMLMVVLAFSRVDSNTVDTFDTAEPDDVNATY